MLPASLYWHTTYLQPYIAATYWSGVGRIAKRHPPFPIGQSLSKRWVSFANPPYGLRSSANAVAQPILQTTAT
jgi:hypothetical protein